MVKLKQLVRQAYEWLVDEQARSNLKPFILQSVMATLAILVILLFLDVIEHTALIATLGSSTFLVFTRPSAYSAHARPLIGGYIIGLGVGALFYYLSLFPGWLSLPLSEHTVYIIYAALAVGLAIFLMVITDTEHPPAAGAALGLVLNTWGFKTLMFMLAAVLSLAVLRRALQRFMVDLV